MIIKVNKKVIKKRSLADAGLAALGTFVAAVREHG